MHEIQEEVKARARAGPCPVSLIQQISFIQLTKHLRRCVGVGGIKTKSTLFV